MDPVCEKREKALSDSTQFDEHLGILSVFSLTQSLFQSDFTSYNPEIKEKNQHISVIVGLLSDKSTKGKKKTISAACTRAPVPLIDVFLSHCVAIITLGLWQSLSKWLPNVKK